MGGVLSREMLRSYFRIFCTLCIREGGDVQIVPSVVAQSVGKPSPCLLDDRNVTLKVARVSSPSLYFCLSCVFWRRYCLPLGAMQ